MPPQVSRCHAITSVPRGIGIEVAGSTFLVRMIKPILRHSRYQARATSPGFFRMMFLDVCIILLCFSVLVAWYMPDDLFKVD
jgi:hypothetical protein